MYRYRVKRLRQNFSATSPDRINLEPYFELLQFTRALDFAQREYVEKIASERPVALADLLAALTYKLFDTGNIKRDFFVEKCLRGCDAILENEGFDIIDINDIFEVTRQAAHCLVIAPGCQTDELLMSRIRATEEICYQIVSMRKQVHLFFSGKNPGQRAGISPSILNEAQTMNMWFWDLWERRQQVGDFRRLVNIQLLIEDGSKTSIENIKRLLALSQRQLLEGSNVFIVSSTFHLIRLAQALERELETNPSFSVPNLILVGSEVGATNISMHKTYVKSMVFNLYRYLISKPQFWQGVSPVIT